MSGYREHGFDPYAFERPGRPMRPYNWVQWCGAAFIAAGIVMLLLYFAGRAGWIAPLVKEVQLSTILSIFGALLINSRREPGTQVGSEQLQRNRRVLLITVAIVAAILGVVTVIEFSGA
jgi:hypothetical protein